MTHSPDTSRGPAAASAPNGWLDEFALLWVSGLALLVAVLPEKLFALQGKGHDWVPYLLVGTLFPALVTALVFSTRSLNPTAATSWQVPLALILVGGAFFYLAPHFRLATLVLAVVQWALMTAFSLLSGLRESGASIGADVGSAPEASANQPPPVPPTDTKLSRRSFRRTLRAEARRAPVGLFISIIAWTLGARLFWWDPSEPSALITKNPAVFETWVFGSPYTLGVLMVSAVFVAWAFQRPGRPSGGGLRLPRWVNAFASLAGLVALAALSFRKENFPWDAHSTAFHWSPFLRPAALVRQGGWLQWDVPSQYGFLSIVTLAAFPAKSVWQSLYLLNGSLTFLAAAFLFLIWRSPGGLLNYGFALAVSLAALLISGWPATLEGPQMWPSVGAFRFFWCYALLAVLSWDFFANRAGAGSRRVLWAGCGVWVLGTLWSFESAVYCAVIWLPAYAVLCVRDSWDPTRGAGRRLLVSGLWLLLPPCLLALALGLVAAYYRLFLGHVPDWTGFAEVARFQASTRGFMGAAYPRAVDPRGPVWLLFLLLCAIASVIVYVLRNAPAQALALAWGAWGAVWAPSSYYWAYPQSNDKITQLVPLYCAAIGLILMVLRRYAGGTSVAAWVRMSFAPVLTVLLTATFGNFAGLHLAAYGVPKRYVHVEQLLPPLERIDKSAASLLSSAGVSPEDRIFFIKKAGYYPPFSDTCAWLPFEPWEIQLGLPEHRKGVYLSRFVERTHLSGYLLLDKSLQADSSVVWFMDRLSQTHVPVKSFENEEYELIYFELRSREAPGSDQRVKLFGDDNGPSDYAARRHGTGNGRALTRS